MILTVIATFLATAASLHAAPAVEDFCDDPYTAVCGPKGEVEEAREAKILEIKKQIARAARERIAREQLPRTDYLKILMLELKAELGESHRSATFHFERIKRSLVPAVRALADVSREESNDMLAELGIVRFVDAAALISGHSRSRELTANVIESCGADGMNDNAFAFTLEDGGRYVVLCPGAAVAALGPYDKHLKASELALAGVIWTLGHETGHHIDSVAHPIAYEKLKSCLATHYSDQLGATAYAGLDAYMSEISADYWGAEELAGYLEAISEPERKLRVLEESLEFLCGTEDDGVHPSGRFRIENLVRRNPRIQKTLGCAPFKTESNLPACTLRGAVI